MRGPHNIWRLIQTGATFERTGAMHLALRAVDAPRPIRFAARALGLPFRFFGYHGDEAHPPVLRALIALGPAYIKFGQLLSTRPDIVGDELARELSVLQDKLPPFSKEEAISVIESDLHAGIDSLFTSFEDATAAASLAQVHPATMANGQKLAVKVLRPGIERAFLRDVDAFHLGAWIVEKITPKSRRLRPRDVVAHFEHIVRNELDLRMEASVGSEYSENTRSDPDFETPKIIWTHSNRRVLTTSWLDGLPLSEEGSIAASGVDPASFARLILHSFLTQALRDGLFHADMHQGNLKIGTDGKLQALDFGIMGRIDAFTRRVYAEILYGFLQRDYQRVARVHFEAGYVPGTQDVAEFAQALRSVGEPIFGEAAEQISMARLLGHLFEITETFGMETRTELILLQRTMVVVEGVARSIDPDINIWEAARPAVERYIRDNVGPRAALRDLREHGLALARVLPQLPGLVERLGASQPPRPRSLGRSGYALAGIGGAILALILFR